MPRQDQGYGRHGGRGDDTNNGGNDEMEITTVEELPFDPRPEDLEPGPYADLLDAAEPDDHADAVFDEASEIAGLHVKLLMEITKFAARHEGDRDSLEAIKAVFHWNPKHLIRAYKRRPSFFDPRNADSLSWEDIVRQWTLGKVNDDLRAFEIEDEARSHSWDLAQLRDAVKAANGKRERKPNDWEQVAELVTFQRSVGGYADGDRLFNIIETLAAIRSVAKVLEAKQ